MTNVTSAGAQAGTVEASPSDTSATSAAEAASPTQTPMPDALVVQPEPAVPGFHTITRVAAPAPSAPVVEATPTSWPPPSDVPEKVPAVDPVAAEAALEEHIIPADAPVPGFNSLGLSLDLQKAVAEAGYTTPTPIQAQGIPACSEAARHHRHRADGHRQDRILHPADDRAAGARPRQGAHAALADSGADARTRRTGRRKFRALRQVQQAFDGAADRRRVVRRPGQQTRPRRRCADRHAGPPARSFRARQADALPGADSRHRRSRPHARHGLHSRRRAHLQADPLHAADPVLFGDHAAGNPAADRSVPAQSGARGSGAPGHDRREHPPGDHRTFPPTIGPSAKLCAA